MRTVFTVSMCMVVLLVVFAFSSTAAAQVTLQPTAPFFTDSLAHRTSA